MTPSSPPGTAAGKRAPAAWLYGPATDLLIGCGAWSLPLLALAYVASRGAGGAMAVIFYLLAVFCNNPHYMATVYRAYRTPQDRVKYRLFTYWAGGLLVFMVALLLWKPAFLPAVFTAYVLWSPWHYTGQNYGIAMMMARRNGARPENLDRNLIHLFFVASFVLWAVDFNTTQWDDPRLLSLGLRREIALPVESVLSAVCLVSGVWGVGRLSRRAPGRALGAPVAIMTTQLLWFFFPVAVRMSGRLEVSPLFYSTGMLAFMHCAQYLWVTSHYARRESQNAGNRNWSFARYYLILVTGGVALFIPGPWIISLLFKRDLVESLFIFIALVNLHHFILDGVIWKLRDARIARLLLGGATPSSESEVEAEATSPASAWVTGKTPGARAARWGLVGSVLAIGAVDQIQYLLTTDPTTTARLRAAEAVNANDTRVYFQRAKILRNDGRIDAALAELDRAIAVNPRNIAPQSLKGELLSETGRFDAAFRQFDRMTALFKPMPMVLINAAVFAVRSGQADKAVADYERAIALNPDDAGLHLGLAEAYELSKRPREAAKHYAIFINAVNGRATTWNPRLPAAEMKLAETCLDLSMPGKAIWWYQAASVQARQSGELSLADRCVERLRQLVAAYPPADPRPKKPERGVKPVK